MKQVRAASLAPAAIVMAALFLAPLAIVCGYSVLTRGAYGGAGWPLTAESYTRLVDPLYAIILWRSVWIAVTATAMCLLLGFPLALFLSRSKRKNLFLALVILPFWTSFLIRTYAWMFLLRDTGLVNTTLLSVGLIAEPLVLLYNTEAVLLGLVYAHLPFMVLPLYASLERIDRSMVEASADLGAHPLVTLARIIVPLASPGIKAGSVLVFIPCLGAFLTPDLLGGAKTVMIGNLIQNQFTTARDWPFGSAVSLVLTALVMALLLFVARRGGEEML